MGLPRHVFVDIIASMICALPWLRFRVGCLKLSAIRAPKSLNPKHPDNCASKSLKKFDRSVREGT